MKFHKGIFSYLLLYFLVIDIGIAQNVPKKLHSNPVQDYANLLSNEEQASLNEKLIHYTDSTSTSIVIVIQKDIEDDINYQASQYLSQWGVGQKRKDNGVLILMAVNQRKIAISTGYGVEDKLTDAISRRIIEQKIIPYFKNQEYYLGFDRGTSAIIDTLAGKFQKEKLQKSDTIDYRLIFFILVPLIFIIAIILRNKKNSSNNGGKSNGGIDLLDILILLSSSGRSTYGRGSGFGGSSGGFGGFGGGLGGGGGASGSW